MATNSSITVEFIGDLSKLRRDLDQATQEVGSLSERISARLDNVGRSLQKVGTGLTLGVTAPLLAVGKLAVDSAEQLSTVRAITEQVIKQTGSAANVTAGQVNELTKQLERQTGVDDKLIQAGSNILLTFKEIRNEQGRNNDIFNRANEIMLDLATVTGTDATSAATQLGKALNDPVKGVTALQRVGVSFTEQQREQIAAMVESGDTLGAQKLILRELESQYGGTAKASANATDKISQSWENVRERLGKALLPFIERLQKLVTRLAKRFEGLTDQQVDMVVKVAAVVAAVGPMLIVLGTLVRTVSTLITVVKGLSVALAFLAANPVVLVIAAVAALAAGLVIAYKRSEAFRQRVDDAFRRVREILATTREHWDRDFEKIRRFMESARRTMATTREHWDRDFEAARDMVTTTRNHWDRDFETMRGFMADARDVSTRTRNHWDRDFEAVRRFLTGLRDTWDARFADIRRFTSDTTARVRELFRDRLGDTLAAVREWTGDVVAWFRGLPDRIGRAVSGLGRTLREKVADVISGIKINLPFSFSFGGDGLGELPEGRGSGSLLGISESSTIARLYRSIGSPGTVTSGFRPGSRTLSGALSYHAQGRALDFTPIQSVAQLIYSNPMLRALTKELISPWPWLGIYQGRPHRFSAAVQAQHSGSNAHIHWAAERGAYVKRRTTFEHLTMAERHPEVTAPEPMLRRVVREEAGAGAQMATLIDRLDRQHFDTRMLLRQLIRAVQAGHVIDERSFAHALAPEMGRALAR